MVAFGLAVSEISDEPKSILATGGVPSQQSNTHPARLTRLEVQVLAHTQSILKKMYSQVAADRVTELLTQMGE